MQSFLTPNCVVLVDVVLTVILTFNVNSSINCGDASHFEQIKSKGIELGEVFGNPIKPTEYTYVVGLALVYTNGNLGVCTGTLISNKIVLTAAHCYDETIDHIKVYKSVCPLYGYGNNNTDYRNVSEYKIHANKDEHDIMILVLKKPFNDVKKFAKLYGCLKILRSNVNIPQSLETFSIGCGDTEKKYKCMKPPESAAKTKHVIPRRIIPIVTSYIPNFCVSKKKITRKEGKCDNNMFHVRKICAGDIGGPLLYVHAKEVKQIGIIKDDCENTEGPKTCGCKNMLSAQTNVYSYKDWIHEMTNIKMDECSEIKSKISPVDIFILNKSKVTRAHFTIKLLTIVNAIVNVFLYVI